MARDPEADRRNSGQGDRRASIPEPRPVADGHEKSLLVSRHMPDTVLRAVRRSSTPAAEQPARVAEAGPAAPPTSAPGPETAPSWVEPSARAPSTRTGTRGLPEDISADLARSVSQEAQRALETDALRTDPPATASPVSVTRPDVPPGPGTAGPDPDPTQTLPATATPAPMQRAPAVAVDATVTVTRTGKSRTAPAPRVDPGDAPTEAGVGRKSVPMPTGSPVVPPQSVAGRALMLVVGIMCFLACLSVGALVLVEEAARDWQLDVAREVTIQVKPVDGQAMEPMLQTAMALARATAGVRSVRLMSERDSAGLLEPWLGPGFDMSQLPVPRLILLDLADPASADLKGLSAKLADQVKSAILDDHSIWAKRLRTMAGTMVAAGTVVLILVLVAMVLSVVFATRAAMAGNRDVVEVLHFVGAEDSFIAGEFQHHFLILGFKGGIGGGVGAMAAFAAAGWITRETPGLSGSDQAHALFGGFSLGLNAYIGAVGIVLLVAGLTAITSRLTVRSYLNQLD